MQTQTINATFQTEEKHAWYMALFTILPVKAVLLIPHMIVTYFLSLVASLGSLIGIFVVLFTGKYPKPFANLLVGMYRWQWRICAYMYCMTDQYPPFSLESDKSFPADVQFQQPETSSRKWALLTIIPVKIFLLLPHMVVLLLASIAAFFIALWAVLSVLFTQQYPKYAEEFLVKYQNYMLRVNIYIACISDQYPEWRWA